jgi:hypothetical protein
MPKKDLTALALPAVQDIASSDEDQLFTQLGKLVQMNRLDPKSVSDFVPSAEPEYETLGLASDLKMFGKKYFDRVNAQAYNLVCGADAEDSAERKNLVTAFGLGKAEVTASLAVLLVAQLAMAPAIATIVAALTVKLFFSPAYDAMCEVWKGKLPG